MEKKKKCQGTCKESKPRDCFSDSSWLQCRATKRVCIVCRSNGERKEVIYRNHTISKPIGEHIQKTYEALNCNKIKNKESTKLAMEVVELINVHHDWSLDHWTDDNYKNTRTLIKGYRTRNISSWNIDRSQKKPRAKNGTVGVGVKKMNQKAYAKFLKSTARVTNAPNTRGFRARGVSRFT